MQARPPHNNVLFNSCSNEHEARNKLADYVYEYLVHIGATKTAESFKNEIMNKGPDSHPNIGDAPGFLYNWWCVFWDLYSAVAERREKSDPSQEAKAYHDWYIQLMSGPPMMNGIHGPPQFPNAMPAGIPPQGVDGGFNGRYMQMPPSGTRSGAPTPVMGVPPNFPSGQLPSAQQQMFINEQMRMGPRMPQQIVRLNYQPGGSCSGPQIRPQMRQYIDSPSNTPSFPSNQMLQNGSIICQSASVMSSPGHSGQPTNMPPDGLSQERYMMMNSNMNTQYINQQETGTPIGNGGPLSVSGGMCGNSSESNIVPTSAGGNGSGQLQNLLNGGEQINDVKQSPSSIQGGANNSGGTPGSGGPQSTSANMITSAGPSSVTTGMGPSSVHSQTGVILPNGGSVPPHQQQQQQPTSTAEIHAEDHQEISKIKATLMEGW